MVAPFVRPLSVSAGTAAVLVYIESILLGSLPSLVIAVSSIGPFVPLIDSVLKGRRVVTQEDAHYVYEPLYEAISKNGQQIASIKTWGQLPMFQRQEIDQIRMSARYSLLKTQTPAVEELVKSMDLIFDNQGGAHTSASRIVAEAIHSNTGVLQYDGDAIAFHGITKDDSPVNFAGGWITNAVILGFYPLDHYRAQGIKITSMDITEKNNVKGSLRLPVNEQKVRFLWEIVEKRATDDMQIMTVRSAIAKLPSLESQAEKQVLDKIKKSRSSF